MVPLDPSMKIPILMRIQWKIFWVSLGAESDPLIIPDKEK